MQPDRDSPGVGPLFVRPALERFASSPSGVPYVVARDSGVPGPNIVLSALVHGNELCGADALCRLIEADIQPVRGRLSFVFANVAAYQSFDPAQPFASRYLDEDMNRLWRDDVLDQPARSREHARAKALRPLFAGADALLDLHSTASDSPPMLLCGRTEKARRLARALGIPADIVADAGHAAGPRLIEFGAFARENQTPTALLIECGQHFDPASRGVALECALRFLREIGVLEAWPSWAEPPSAAKAQRLLEVSHAVTIKTDRFAFVRSLGAFERIAHAGTLIAYDGGTPVTTPYHDCIAVMPSLSPTRGETAVRLARALPFDRDAPR